MNLDDIFKSVSSLYTRMLHHRAFTHWSQICEYLLRNHKTTPLEKSCFLDLHYCIQVRHRTVLRLSTLSCSYPATQQTNRYNMGLQNRFGLFLLEL